MWYVSDKARCASMRDNGCLKAKSKKQSKQIWIPYCAGKWERCQKLPSSCRPWLLSAACLSSASQSPWCSDTKGEVLGEWGFWWRFVVCSKKKKKRNKMMKSEINWLYARDSLPRLLCVVVVSIVAASWSSESGALQYRYADSSTLHVEIITYIRYRRDLPCCILYTT